MHVRVHRNPHNDLGNLAYYHLSVIRAKLEAKDEEGLSLDCTSFLIAAAFHVEALINFLGARCVKDWRERTPYGDKLKIVLNTIGYNLPEGEEPRASLLLLKEVRDGLAHAKPDEVSRAVPNEGARREVMGNAWDRYLEPKVCEQVYEAVVAFKRTALEHAGIRLGQTLTSSIGGGNK